ncbi:MAG: hypothetical protein WA958_18510 [Tunicatimonas sp.]
MKLLGKKAPKKTWQYRVTHAEKNELIAWGVLTATVLGAAFVLERHAERFFLID